MDQIEELFHVTVNDNTYTVTRFLENRTDKVETYGFKTVIDGREIKLSANLCSETANDLSAQYGVRVLKELTDTLITEFQTEISKLTRVS